MREVDSANKEKKDRLISGTSWILEKDFLNTGYSIYGKFIKILKFTKIFFLNEKTYLHIIRKFMDHSPAFME